MDYFDGIIGQEKAKKKLTLYIDGYKKSSLLPNLMFEGAQGAGKTHLCHKLAKAVGKEWIEVNGGSITNVSKFIDYVVVHMINKSILVFIDEFHALPNDVENFLLSVTNPTMLNINTVSHDGVAYEFDFRKVSFICATTERQKVFKPLLGRFTPVSLSAYNHTELGMIIKQNAAGTAFENDAERELATYTRGTARSATLMGREVLNYSTVYDLKYFKKHHIPVLMDILDIFPKGLTEGEVTTLGYIRDAGRSGIMLTELAAKTGHNRDAQQEAELYLQKMGLMRIEGKRKVTQEGMNYLTQIGR